VVVHFWTCFKGRDCHGWINTHRIPDSGNCKALFKNRLSTFEGRRLIRLSAPNLWAFLRGRGKNTKVAASSDERELHVTMGLMPRHESG
jgi:hypothetical protein